MDQELGDFKIQNQKKVQLMNRLYNIKKNKNKQFGNDQQDRTLAINLNTKRKHSDKQERDKQGLLPKLYLPVLKKESLHQPIFNETYMEQRIVDKARKEVSSQLSHRKTFKANKQHYQSVEAKKKQGMEAKFRQTSIRKSRQNFYLIKKQSENQPVAPKPVEMDSTNIQVNTFFKMVRQKKLTADEFIYMVRKQMNDHYNMEVIPYSKILESQKTKDSKDGKVVPAQKTSITKMIPNQKIKDYYTFSSKGVTKFMNGKPVQFITVSDWFDEVKSFNQIGKYKFFNTFRKWKALKKWCKIISSNNRKVISDILNQKMFLANKMYQKILLNHKRICYQIQNLTFVSLVTRQAMTKEEFLKSKTGILQEFTTALSAFSTKLHQNTDTGIKSLLNGLKSKVNKEDSKKEGLLGFPQNMNYGDRAIMRQELINIVRIAYLAEFITIESLGKCYIKNGTDILSCLQKPLRNDKYKRQLTLFEQQHIKVPPNPIDPLFNLTFSFKTYPDIKQEFIKYQQDDQKLILFDLSYWQQFKYRIFPGIQRCIVIDPYQQQLTEILISAFKQSSIEKGIRNWRSKMEIYVNALQEWDDVVGGRNRNNQNIDQFLNPFYWIKEQQSYINLFTSIKSLMDRGFQFVYKLRRQYNEYLNIFQRQFTANVQLLGQNQFKGGNQMFQRIVKINDLLLEKLQKNLIERSELGLFQVNCQLFNKQFIEEQRKNISRLHRFMEKHLEQLQKDCQSFLQKSISRLSIPMVSIQQYAKQKENLTNLNATLPEIIEKLSLLNSLPQLLPPLRTPNLKQSINSVLVMGAQHTNLMNQMQNLVSTSTDKFKKQYKQLQKKTNKQIEDLLQQVMDKKWLTESGGDIVLMKPKVDELDAKVNKLNSFQDVLGMNGEGNYQSLYTLKSQFQLRYSVWVSFDQFDVLKKQWDELVFKKVEAKPMIQKTQQYIRVVNQAERNLPQNVMVPKLKELVWRYKQTLPAVLALRSQYLLPQHWQQIRQLIKAELDPEDTNLKLKDLFNLNISEYAAELIEISTKALQQSQLRNSITQIQSILNETETITKPYKQTSILIQVDELTIILDQALANLNNILASRYVKSLKIRAEKDAQQVQLMMDIIQKWTQAQRKWIYLQNIFGAADIKKQMAQQSRDFQVCDKVIKNSIKRFVNGRLNKLIKPPNLLDKLIQTTASLQKIEKSLENYLESKRILFPRFYFLSNDQLLEILAKANSLELIEQHLPKCFQGLVRLFVGEGKNTATTNIIEGMISPEKQIITFKVVVIAKGNVENWLQSLQKQMYDIMKKIISSGFKDYMMDSKKTKTQWIKTHKSQVVAVASQMIWTWSTEESIKESATNSEALTDQLNSIVKQLEELTNMVRSDLSSILRKVVISLMTTEVHNRDIVQQLVNLQCQSLNDFQWLQQLRYYANEDQTIVKQVTSVLGYGYQYLGATSRLVITPLTDRCWITITSALANKLGASPAGPAGTGKTESTKDLAKGLGRLCIVFNCSDQITAAMMIKLFKGLAQQGAWSCLDQFNRIDIEVLSVIAQQLLVIRMALLKNQNPFEFQGQLITMKPNYGVFITMNPGYAGRTQLPDNLKSLFRPVSMMIPDYAMIAQIMLYAQGFRDASPLSKKMVQLYKLSSQQLSQQDHYDFGMRAVKSLLVTAGSLKRAQPDLEEDTILIKAMKSSNIPKFIKADIPLFISLIYDLFPAAKISESQITKLEQMLPEQLKIMKLQPSKVFEQKVIQLYDTFNVRFGVMLVGQSGSGKSTCYKALAHISNTMAKNKQPTFTKVEYRILNPKSISMGELYGQIDLNTQEWVDGLGSSIIRQVNTNQIDDPNWDPTQKYWVVFDGPIDSLWIESMNTVLDDNMTLCLASSQRIKLRSELRMLFQVQDLSVASPATVSRCGMVYLSFDNLHWSLYVKSWMDRVFTTDPNSTDPHKFLLPHESLEMLMGLFHKSIQKGFQKKKHIYEPFPTTMIQVGRNICSILQAILPNMKLIPQQTNKILTTFYIYSYIWGFAGGMSSTHILQITKIIQDMFDFNFPKADGIYDYYINPDNQKTFLNWNAKIPEFVFTKQIPFFQLLVPTIDTVKYSHLIQTMLTVQKPIILTGDSGVGKSAIVSNLLNQLKVKRKINSINLNFSAQTKAKEVQLAIQAKLHKKGKTLFGARPNQKICIFIDDINMPALQFYGAQPCIQLLRQLQDLGGFYDRVKLFFKQIVDFTLLPVCAPPGGGRNQLTFRFLRHMIPLMFPSPNTSTAFKIFNSLLAPNCSFAQPIVYTTIAVFEKVSKQLLPTPSKFHYVFNMRDIGKVIQGIGKGKQQMIVKLYIHELRRVFADRMLTQDYVWFKAVVTEAYKRYFSNPNLLTQDTFNGLFTDIIKLDQGVSIYQQVIDKRKLIKCLADKQQDYNFSSDDKLHLVFFDDAIQQILRICRILRQPRGNAMLIGVGGSGKQSLSKLSSFIMKCVPYQIQLVKNYNSDSFRGDLQKIARQSGANNRQLSFIFTDVQIAYESFLEDINNVLNTGQVPNLFQKKEDIDQIINLVRPQALKNKIQDSPQPLWNYFINNIRENLHIILCMSPVGQALRVRCRKFPSLVNCCSLDWFPNWPKQALLSVATKFLKQIQMQENLRVGLAEMCMLVSVDVTKSCDKYYKQLRRKVYTTPKSYLDQIKLYQSLLALKRDDMNKIKKKLSFGLEKLYATNNIVAKLKVQMKQLQPKLAEQSIKTQKFLVQLAQDRLAASKKQSVVQEQALIVNIQQSEIKVIADQAQLQLAKAVPALKQAQEALNKLNKNDITQIKSFTSPPPAVAMVIQAVCVLLGQKGDWASARQVMIDLSFLDRLKTFDKTSISEGTLKKLRALTNKPQFDPNIVQSKSLACKSLCLWCRAMDNFCKISKEVEPKKKKVAQMSSKLQVKNKELKVKQDELQKVKQKVAKLQKQCDETLALKNQLEADIVQTAKRLQSAQKLTVLLHDQGIRWKQQISTIGNQIQNLIGDVFLSAATISYLGPFTSNYRDPLIQQWKQKFKQLNIPFSENYSLANTLETPIRIRDWIMEGLANDTLSVDNGVITTKCQRWPLLIDPQGEANKWIKKHEKNNNLNIVNFTTPNFLKTIQTAISSGYTVLIENVQERLEPSIDSVLQKQIYESQNRKLIRVGDKVLDYHPMFKLYITTKMSNPHYLPEIYIKVTVINFSITFEGLKDQLLGEVMKFQLPEIEKQRDEVVVSIANGKKTLKQAQDNILTLLSQSKGMILDNLELIKTLEDSKKHSEIIKKSLQETTGIQEKINNNRNNFIPVSIRGTVLYFVISQLSLIDPMYQFSLTYFKKLFNTAMFQSVKSNIIQTRLLNLNDSITKRLFTDICRGLFESHKKIYSFLICTSIKRQNQSISAKEWNLLIRGTTNPTNIPNPDINFISQPNWEFLVAVGSNIEQLNGLPQHIKDNLATWKQFFKNNNCITCPLPKPYQNIKSFNRLFLIRGMAFQKIMKEFSNYTSQQMGSFYQQVKNASMEEVFNNSDEKTPIIFILSTGADPTAALLKFAQQKNKTISVISLGQGQGKKAQNLIERSVKDGSWVLLTNCHLAKSWMPNLEAIVLKFNQKYEGSDSFRLFLTSMPANYFPVAVLQNGIKLTTEPPRGLKANLIRSYQDVNQQFLDNCENKNKEWHKLLFSLSFFHAIIQQRRKFGPLGFNIRYEFNDSDLFISNSTLKMFLSDQDQIPWDAMLYMTGHINYGGRVTDDWDRTCLLAILKKYYNQDIINNEKYQFSPSKIYHVPQYGTIDTYRNYIKKLPNFEDPEVFGMHENANITFQNQESSKIMETILNIQPRISVTGGGKSSDQIVSQMAANLLVQVPTLLDKDKGNQQLFTLNETGNMKSLSIVLLQQIEKFNNLLSTLSKTLLNLQKAIQGLVIMSQDLDQMYLSFQNNVLPPNWKKVSYSSLKPLSSWFKDMILRVDFMKKWLHQKSPHSYWMSGFYFPQGFLTGVLQTHSRLYKIPIDTLNFKFRVLPYEKEKLTNSPSDGVYVDGLFFDGARWDIKDESIVDQTLGKLYFSMPVIHFLPMQKYILPDNYYRCPCYKTSNRAGVLSTTGQSTNFILPVDLHTKFEKHEFWTLRGTALLCQLDD